MCKERQMDFKRNNMKKIYLSGPISGRPLEEAREQFDTVEKFLQKKFGEENIKVFNPMTFNTYAPEKKWQDYMHLCLYLLEDCDAILMLDGWKDSIGAQVEYLYAYGCGIESWVWCSQSQEILTGHGFLTPKKITHSHDDGVKCDNVRTDECRGHAIVDDSEQPNSL